MAYVLRWQMGSRTLSISLFCRSVWMYTGLFYRSLYIYMLDLRHGTCVKMVNRKLDSFSWSLLYVCLDVYRSLIQVSFDMYVGPQTWHMRQDGRQESWTLSLGLLCWSVLMYVGLFYGSLLSYVLDLRYGTCAQMVDWKLHSFFWSLVLGFWYWTSDMAHEVTLFLLVSCVGLF